MNGISTLTQKGQVAIPKAIRDYFDLKPSDKIRFSIWDKKIIAEPVLDISDMLGIIYTKKKLSKRDYKKTIREQVLKKYASRS